MKSFEELLAAPLEQAACVDWKGDAGDVLRTVRDCWALDYPQLADARLDSLAENYAAENCRTYLPALGQELSAMGLRLYALPADSDDYCLAVVAEAEAGAFEAITAERQKEPLLEKQPKRALGQPAKRLDLGKKLRHKQAALHQYGLDPAGSFALIERWQEEPCGWITLNGWPPSEQALPADVECHRLAHHDAAGVTAAIIRNKLTGQTDLRIGRELPDLSAWERVPDSDGPWDMLTSVAFLGDDLLLAHEGKAWAVQDAARGGRVPRVVAEAPVNRDFQYPGFASSGDKRHWLMLAGRIHAWSKSELRQTALPIRRSIDFHVMPTARGFAYMALDGEMVELDVSTGQERTRAVEHLGPKTTLRQIRPGWAILLRWGDIQRSLDLAQFWHPATERWLRVPFGALGKHGWRDVLVTPQTHRIWASNNAGLFDLGPFDALIGELSMRKQGPFQPAPWSEWTSVAATPVPITVDAGANSREKTLLQRMLRMLRR